MLLVYTYHEDSNDTYMDPCCFKAPEKLLSKLVCFPRPAWAKLHVDTYVWRRVYACVYVGLPSVYEKTNLHTYIRTNKLTTRQVGFCTTPKLEFRVCLPTQATE